MCTRILPCCNTGSRTKLDLAELLINSKIRHFSLKGLLEHIDIENEGADNIISACLATHNELDQASEKEKEFFSRIRSRVTVFPLKATRRELIGYEDIVLDMLRDVGLSPSVLKNISYMREIGSSYCCLGDSHTIGIVQALRMGGVRCSSHLCVGTKIWHLKSLHKNIITSLEDKLKGKKRVDNLLLSFGDIDCREDEGILHHHRNKQVPINTIIDDTLECYKQFIRYLRVSNLAISKIYILPIIYHAGSAVTHPQSGKSSPVNREVSYQRLELIKEMNTRLTRISNEYNCKFLDVTYNASDFLPDQIHLSKEAWLNILVNSSLLSEEAMSSL